MWGIEMWPLTDNITLESQILPCLTGESKNITFIVYRISHCGVITLHPVWPFAKFVHLLIYLNMQKEFSQLTIFTKKLTCFIQYAFITLLIQLIHYLFISRHWRLPFCLYLSLAITWLLPSAHMTETHSSEREKRKRLYFLKLILFWSSLNF